MKKISRFSSELFKIDRYKTEILEEVSFSFRFDFTFITLYLGTLPHSNKS